MGTFESIVDIVAYILLADKIDYTGLQKRLLYIVVHTGKDYDPTLLC